MPHGTQQCWLTANGGNPSFKTLQMALFPYLEAYRLEAGCDEAGWGCLAGPVVAAAVILPEEFEHEWLRDSKQMTAKRRETLRVYIETLALAWAVAAVGERVIETINILQASLTAMHEAVQQLSIQPHHLLIDGNTFKPYPNIPHSCIVKGDQKYQSIAAASVLAKTHRDAHMLRLHQQFPVYQWDSNKGYPTKSHRQAIVNHGITDYHRQTFQFKTNDLVLPES